jgi:hypothetical protein
MHSTFFKKGIVEEWAILKLILTIHVRVCRPGAAIFDTFQNIQRIDKYASG